MQLGHQGRKVLPIHALQGDHRDGGVGTGLCADP